MQKGIWYAKRVAMFWKDHLVIYDLDVDRSNNGRALETMAI
jgi:hypothetical protein